MKKLKFSKYLGLAIINIVLFTIILTTQNSLWGAVEQYIDETTGLIFDLDNETKTAIVTGFESSEKTITNMTIPQAVMLNDVEYIVRSIGNGTFFGCSNLKSIDIPARVKNIGCRAFFGCSNLESIDIPAGVKNIGRSAFCKCNSLKSVIFLEDSELECIEYEAFNICKMLAKVDIPAGVKNIGRSAFCGCSSLKSVTFAENSKLKNIETGAFAGCINLSEIKIPAEVESIGEYAFLACDSLKSVIFAEGSKLKIIGEGVFKATEIKSAKQLKSKGYKIELYEDKSLEIKSDGKRLFEPVTNDGDIAKYYTKWVAKTTE